MKDLKLMDVNGRPREVTISPAFIQIVEDANSINCPNARARIITNTLNDSRKKITYLVRETPNQIYEVLKEEGINLLNFTSTNGMPKKVFIKPFIVVNVENYNRSYNTNAHSKIYTNLSNDNGGMYEYVASETKEEINDRIMQIQKM